MENSRGKLIVVSAPSGAGKTTLVHHLLKSAGNIDFSVSATSREMRSGERNGIDYHFLTTDEFRRKAEAGDFLEWEEVYPGVYYGTLRSAVEASLTKGRNVVFDVDVKGGLSIKRIYGQEALCIFIMPPSIDELERRLRLRSSDPEKSIRKRLDKAAFEMGFANQFDLRIVNENLETAKENILDAVMAFLSSNTI